MNISPTRNNLVGILECIFWLGVHIFSLMGQRDDLNIGVSDIRQNILSGIKTYYRNHLAALRTRSWDLGQPHKNRYFQKEILWNIVNFLACQLHGKISKVWASSLKWWFWWGDPFTSPATGWVLVCFRARFRAFGQRWGSDGFHKDTF